MVSAVLHHSSSPLVSEVGLHLCYVLDLLSSIKIIMENLITYSYLYIKTLLKINISIFKMINQCISNASVSQSFREQFKIQNPKA